MKRKIYILIISLLSLNSSFSQENLQMDTVIRYQDILKQYLITGAKNNAGLKAKFNEYAASLEKVPQAGTLPDPQLTFGYFIMPVETRNGPQRIKISLTQMFPWFGTLNTKENVFISAAKARYEEFEEAKSKLFFEIKSVYYELYFIKKAIDVSKENIEILNTFKRLALIKIEAGKSSSVDEFRVEMELNDLENNLALLKDKWFANSVKFNNLLNVDNYTEIIIPENLRTDDIKFSRQAMIDSLTKNNHKLKRLDLIKESLVFSQKQREKSGYPGIILGVDYIATGSSGISPDAGKDALMVRFGITIPLYRKKYSAMVNEIVIRQHIADDKKQETKNILKTLFEKAYSEYSDANRRIDLFRKQTILAKRTIKLLENEYINNDMNFEEILRMERKVLKYSLELEKAKADKQAAIAFINYLMGI